MRPDMIPNLPPEIISDILSRLTVKPLCRFLAVSKPWKALITDPHFIKSHLQRQFNENKSHNQLLIVPSRTFPFSIYSVNLQNRTINRLTNPWIHPLKILGSCYGVVLVGHCMDKPLALWNPSTRKIKFIPSAPTTDLYGISYDSANDEVKVVMGIGNIGTGPLTFQLFSARSSSWKRITQDFAFCFHNTHFGRRGAILNGVPHWVARRCNDMSGDNLIVYFDPTADKFGELPLPRVEATYPHPKPFELTVFCGNLCAVKKDNYEIGVWVMKEPSSWSKLFVVLWDQPNEFLMPLCFGNRDGEVIMGDYNTLVSYNLKENKSAWIGLPQGCKMLETSCYIRSLVSP